MHNTRICNHTEEKGKRSRAVMAGKTLSIDLFVCVTGLLKPAPSQTRRKQHMICTHNEYFLLFILRPHVMMSPFSSINCCSAVSVWPLEDEKVWKSSELNWINLIYLDLLAGGHLADLNDRGLFAHHSVLLLQHVLCNILMFRAYLTSVLNCLCFQAYSYLLLYIKFVVWWE
jgi:hypothetical protein